ncbi:transcriptional regulator [Hungatella effluvii]|uniref:Transcriptional regulator n=1 Tax=Hungatella effluvii TaxID=1096246 RepID=A0A2V3Y6W4_9FIRM|nr:winged helix-turn-helix domain-containing protein [Hungatella effluvii]PXX54276.1 transcriptional regulator [Hungatella effluvii]
MSETDEEMIFGNLHIHPASRTVDVDGRKITLTRMEFDVLCFLAANSNIALTRDQIYETVNGDNYLGGSYVIRDIIYRLRTKLGIPYIQTLHGYGYKFSIEE